MSATPKPPPAQDKKRIAALGRIGVLMGGCSSERPISLKSGTAIFNALSEAGCDAVSLDIASSAELDIIKLLKEAMLDVVFIALHGRFGEDGTLQSILEKVALPYVGSGVEASRNALNKIIAQKLFEKHRVPVPDYTVVHKGGRVDADAVMRAVGGVPFVVKPACEGSSIGITIVDNKNQLAVALEEAFKYDNDVLIERYIKGRELTVGILDSRALPIVEIRPKHAFFDFSAKYEVGMTDYIVPAELPEAVAGHVQSVGLQAHQALGCCNFSRVDVMLDECNSPYVLEVNTIPGFTQTSLLPKAARAAGIGFQELCLTLVELAYRK